MSSEDESEKYTNKRDIDSERDDEALSFIDTFEETYVGHQVFDQMKFFEEINIDVDDPLKLVSEQCNGYDIAHKTIEKIIKHAAKQLFDCYIDKKLPAHVSSESLKLNNLLLENNFQLFDKNIERQIPDLIEEGEEPERPQLETWTRQRMVKKQLEIINYSNEPIKSSNYQKEIKQKAAKKSQYNFLKNLNSKGEEKKDDKPCYIELKNMTEKDQQIEQYRKRKNDEEIEKEEKAKKDKKKAQQARESKAQVDQLKAEIKTKKYTYDYEGQLIIIKKTKAGKLLAATNVTNDVQDVEQEEPPKEKKKEKKVENFEKSPVIINNKKKGLVPVKNKDSTFETQNVYKNFAPVQGVTYIEGGRIRRGQQKLAINNLQKLQASYSKNSSTQIRMSRKEYLNMTQTGNLTRTSLYGTGELKGMKKKSMGEGRQFMSLDKSTLGVSKLRRNLKGKRLPKIRIEKKAKLEEMMKDMDLDSSFDKAISLNRSTQDAQKRQQELLDEKSALLNSQTEVDMFNLQILNSQDFGEKSTGDHGNQDFGIKRSKYDKKRVSLRHSLGKVFKNPRQRQNKQISGQKQFRIDQRQEVYRLGLNSFSQKNQKALNNKDLFGYRVDFR